MRSTLLFCCLALTACGSSLEDFRSAAPSNQGVAIKGPSASMSSGKLSGEQTRQELIGAPALMPGVTVVSTLVVNGSVAITLGIVATIVAHEPASLTDDKAVWGPMTRLLWADEFQFTMTKKAGVYSYVLEGRPKSGNAAFVTLLTGTHNPSLGSASGDFVLDFGATNGLTFPTHQLGRAEVHYQKNSAGDVELKIGFREVGDSRFGALQDSDYAFVQAKHGDGAFEFVVKNNFNTKTSAEEKLSVKSRWKSNGAGRADVTVVGGDTTGMVRFTECWTNELLRSHYEDTVGLFDTEGPASSCSFTSASFSTL